jgi:galactose oxidase
MLRTTCCQLRFPGAIGVLCLAHALLLPARAWSQPAVKGEWGPAFDLENVAIHLHVLSNGRVLYWGRREWNPDHTPAEGLDPPNCTPRLWDPTTSGITKLPQPGFNLFCAGHTFLPDGKLLAAGGHIADGQGLRHATIYDPDKNTWTRIDDMNRGRWYPTLITLADGSVLVSSGSDEHKQVNDVQQIGKNGQWTSIVNFIGLPLYPRMHVAPDGRVFMCGPLQLTQYLDTRGAGQWTVLGDRVTGLREYGCSVYYDHGKVLFVGGGIPPSKTAEVIDLTQQKPAWKATSAMSVGRRHHNATLLPDGTVLVTGGTSGNGGPNNGFNDLTKPVKEVELWDPATETWTVLAAEATPRCYHAAAVLLPDARVLSAGGGEYRPDDVHENDPKDSHRSAQLFSPPYLFRGPRPVITDAPDQVTYGESFALHTPDPDAVSRVTWLSLSSATHSVNATQRRNVLAFMSDGKKLTVTAPATATECPPGPYLLFVLNKQQVPSVAKVVRIR